MTDGSFWLASASCAVAFFASSYCSTPVTPVGVSGVGPDSWNTIYMKTEELSGSREADKCCILLASVYL